MRRNKMMESKLQAGLIGVVVVLLSSILVVDAAVGNSSNSTIENSSLAESSFLNISPDIDSDSELGKNVKEENVSIIDILNSTFDESDDDFGVQETVQIPLNSTLHAEEISSDDQKKEIGLSHFYHIKSSIFKWFQKTSEAIRPKFVENVLYYENESDKDSEYYAKRNEKLVQSLNQNNEPPFNYSVCAQSLPINHNTQFTFCSCGDGVCASYEDKCTCPKDCGSCPPGTVCNRGECSEFVANICMNSLCEDGENEICPWDCKIYMQEEEEEITSNEEQKERAKEARDNAIAFLRSQGLSEEEIAKNLNESEKRVQKPTLPEKPQE